METDLKTSMFIVTSNKQNTRNDMTIRTASVRIPPVLLFHDISTLYCCFKCMR